MTRRRAFVRTLLVSALTPALKGLAQAPRRVAHIGILAPSSSSVDASDLVRALQQLGYVDGRSAVFEWRSSEADGEQFAKLARDLVQRRVDIIITLGSEATAGAKQVTRDIPIVFTAGDPVGAGFVQSLARPGGNLTGVSNQLADLATKNLQLMRDLLPDVTGLLVLSSPANASIARFLRDLESGAGEFRFRIQAIAIASAEDVDPALAAVERARPRAMIVPFSFVTYTNASRISDVAIKNRIVTLGSTRELAEQGLLMSYGPTLREGSNQVAAYVDRILKGARPADLPVEQPTKFELVINLKTAKALAFTIPQSVLVRADEIIQ